MPKLNFINFKDKILKQLIILILIILTIISTFILGNPINPSSFSFKSSNSKIATVDKYGKIKGNNTGNRNVTATVKNTNYNYMFKINVAEK